MLFLSTVWPEPRSSAAGVRTAALLRAFARAGYSLSVGASASPNTASEALEREGAGNPVTCFSVPLNSSAALDAALEASSPSVVVFDRFTSEEAFSWRVREKAPQAARVLDMQDYHALRRARARAVEEAGRKGEDAAAVSAALVARIDTSDRDAIREASAVFRSDLTLVCSPVEREILSASLGAGLAKAKLVPAPLFASRPALGPGRRPGFGARTHFVAIGSFLHPPNVDSLLWLAGRRRRPDKKKGKARRSNDKQRERERERKRGRARVASLPSELPFLFLLLPGASSLPLLFMLVHFRGLVHFFRRASAACRSRPPTAGRRWPR